MGKTAHIHNTLPAIPVVRQGWGQCLWDHFGKGTPNISALKTCCWKSSLGSLNLHNKTTQKSEAANEFNQLSMRLLHRHNETIKRGKCRPAFKFNCTLCECSSGLKLAVRLSPKGWIVQMIQNKWTTMICLWSNVKAEWGKFAAEQKGRFRG